MRNRLRQFQRDERGMSLVFVGLGFTAFLAATTLAVDVGMLMTARTQAQTAADAGALAGAVALAFNNNSDRSTSGPAVQSAVNTALAGANSVIGSPVSIGPSDVTFEPDATGQLNRVRVQVYRTANRSNPVSTLMASMFGITNVDITAAATAEAALASAETCVKPWTIPDKWIERQTAPWDTSDTFSAFPSNPSVFPDIFRNVTMGTYSGYTQAVNVGTQLTLTTEVNNTISPGMYYALRLPGSSGALDFQENITECDASKMVIGNALTIEPAATANDSVVAATELIAEDPSAYWNAAANKVVSTLNPSPRVVVIPLYDPLYFDQGKKVGNFTQLRISNFIGLFIDHLEGNNLVGRITPVAGLTDPSGAAAPVGSFPRAVRLVQ